MTRFSRKTIFELVNALDLSTHASIDDFLFLFGIEKADGRGGIHPRLTAITQYLYAHQADTGPNGGDLVVEVLEYLFSTLKNRADRLNHEWKPESKVPRLLHSLAQDGFSLEGTSLRATLPSELGFAKMDDELTDRLRKLGFDTSLNHLSLARTAHTRGEWASANAQARTFIESLFDETHSRLCPGPGNDELKSHEKKRALANTDPPFFSRNLNEWDGQGKGFVEAFWRRLHPEGSHPGLSDENDSTFRLQLCLLVGLYYIRRLEQRVD